MARSNAPQALSVITVTHEGAPDLTAQEIVKFDGADFGFSHEPTWAAMPKALRGVLDPAKVGASMVKAHPRVQRSVVGLYELGRSRPVAAHSFKDHPSSGLKEVQNLRLSPEVTIMAKASCWYVLDKTPLIPLLQPRLAGLSIRKQAIYLALGRRAFCQGDWSEACPEIIDLSQTGRDGTVYARVITENDLPYVSDDGLNEFIATYLEAQRLAQVIRKERGPMEKKRRARRGEPTDLFGETP